MNIHQMAFNGDLNRIQSVIQSSPDQVNQILEIRDDDGVHRITPIFLAVIKGNIEITKFLLINHAKADSSGELDRLDDWVDLSSANNRYRLRKILYRNKFKYLNCFDVDFTEFDSIRKKIDSIIKKCMGSSIEWGQADIEFYTLIGERGSLERIQELLTTSSLESTRIEAVYMGALSSCRYDVLDFLEDYIDFSNIIKSNLYDMSRLIMNAIVNGNVQALKRFHMAGIDLAAPINGNGADGITLAFIAVIEHQINVLQFLHEIKIDLSEAIKKGPWLGWTPVYKAVELGYVDILELFHKWGVDVEAPKKIQGHVNEHPLVFAITNHQVAVLEFYHKIGVNFDDFSDRLNIHKLSIFAASNNNVPALEFLHRIGMDLTVSSQSQGGRDLIPISVAAYRGYKEVVEYLFSIGVDLSKQMLIGKDLELTPACVAAEHGHVHLLEYFQQCGVNLLEPIHEGSHAGKTPAIIAVLKGHVAVLKFLKTVGVDLAATIKNGEFEGCTLASIAARQGNEKILQYLLSEGINILEELNSGPFKWLNPLSLAALFEKINVVEFFKTQGIFYEVIPSKLKKEHHILIKKSYNQVKPLSEEQTASLLCRKSAEDANWFRNYKMIFFDYMDQIPTRVWAVSGSVNQLKKVYNIYRELKGVKKGWLVHLAVECINLSKKDFNIETLFTSMSGVAIEELKGAVCPGKPLLKLLKWVSMTNEVLNVSSLAQLEAWINGILKQSCQDESYWAEAKGYCEKMYNEMKSKANHKSARGSMKGKKKAAQDPFKNLSDKFDQKIHSVVIPQEDIEKIIQSKVELSSEAFQKLIFELKTLKDSLMKSSDLSLSEMAGAEEAFERFNHQVSDLFEKVTERVARLSENCCNQMRSTSEIKRMVELTEKLEKIHLDKLKKAEDMKTEVLAEVSNLEGQLQRSLDAIKKNREFLLLQTSVNGKLIKYAKRAEENEKDVLATRLNKHLEEHQNHLIQASTVDELLQIKAKFKKELQEVAKIGITLQQTDELSRLKQLLDDSKKRSKLIKKENAELRKQVDALEKHASVRPHSPDKIIPISEKPTRQVLIEKLTPFAPFSNECKMALKMIQGEGKFLTSIEELVRFLGLFKIELENITGSHAKYSDGKLTIVIASHISESTPAQIEDVLRVVLEKLS